MDIGLPFYNERPFRALDDQSIYSQPSTVCSHHSSSHSSAAAVASVSRVSRAGRAAQTSSQSAERRWSYLHEDTHPRSHHGVRKAPPPVAPRPAAHYGSLKRLDRLLPPPYTRPSSAGYNSDDQFEFRIAKPPLAELTGDSCHSLTANTTKFGSCDAPHQEAGLRHQWRHNMGVGVSGNTMSSSVTSNNNNNTSTANKDNRFVLNLYADVQHGDVVDERAQNVTDHVYDEPERYAPPRLPPESGMLSKNQSNVVLRPLAFKPVIPSRYTSGPPHHESGPSVPVSDEGYHSTDIRPSSEPHPALHHAACSAYGRVQKEAAAGERHRAAKFVPPESNRPSDRSESFNSSSYSHMSCAPVEGYIQTPSPSDSGVSELEAILREKDAEIAHLRETMEQNERAIFQVFEEKKCCWHAQMETLSRDCEEKLKAAHQKAFKAEQALLIQMFQLQHERKTLQADNEAVRGKYGKAEERCGALEKELCQVKLKVDEVNWRLQQKVGELSLLKSQLKDAKDFRVGELASLRSQLHDIRRNYEGKCHELERLRETFREGKRQLQQSCQELDRLGLETTTSSLSYDCRDRVANCDADNNDVPDWTYGQQELGKLRLELERERAERHEVEQEYQCEKAQWLDEKNKVICYQKQLQLNYVQMFRKNKLLEGEVEQLMLDLERNDLKQPESTC